MKLSSKNVFFFRAWGNFSCARARMSFFFVFDLRALWAKLGPNLQTTKSTHHPHKIDDQHRRCKTGGDAYFAFFLGSDNSHTTSKIPPDEEGLLWGRCLHAKGVVLCERTCFCLLSTFNAPSIKRSLLRTLLRALSLLKTLTGSF